MIEAPPTPTDLGSEPALKDRVDPAGVPTDTSPAKPAQTVSVSSNRTASVPVRKHGNLVRKLGMALVVLIGVGCGIALARAGAPSTHSTNATVNAASKYFDKTYGTFALESASGVGNAIIDLPPGEAGLVTATYGGQGNFAIRELDATSQSVNLLVETNGSYSGTTAFGIAATTGVQLGIDAGGPWTITLTPFSSAPLMKARNEGTGDAVYRFIGSATDWAVAYDTQGNLVVTSYDTSPLGVDLLIDTIGAYQGTVPATSGPSVVVIEASGAWTVSVGLSSGRVYAIAAPGA